MFVVALLALIAVVYGYPAWRLLSDLPLSPTAGVVIAVGAFLVAALPVVHVLLLRAYDAPGAWRRGLAWAVYLGLGAAVVLFDVVLVRDLTWLALRVLDVAGAAILPVDAAGRAALRTASAWGCLPAGAVLLAWGLYSACRTPPVHAVDVAIDDLPAALDGLRIAHLSDLHVSQTIRRPFVEAVVEVVASLDADLVVFTGDLADGTVDDLRHEVEPLARLTAPLGTWFATGNHDYYHGPSAWLEQIADLGFQILANDHRVLAVGDAHLVIGGLPDPAGAWALPDDPRHHPDVDAVFAGAPPGPRLLLAHQPRLALQAAAAAADLTLSGHTHGGQLWPWVALVRWQQGLVAGLHRRTAGGWIYVSRGVGTWGPPVRLGAPAQIACLTLRRA